MLDNQDTDLHIYRASHLEKAVPLLSFLRKHNLNTANHIIKQYTAASTVLHETKLAKFTRSLKDSLLEEPLVLVGDHSSHRRRTKTHIHTYNPLHTNDNHDDE